MTKQIFWFVPLTLVNCFYFRLSYYYEWNLAHSETPVSLWRENVRPSLTEKGILHVVSDMKGNRPAETSNLRVLNFIINQNWHLRIRNITLKYFCPSWASVHPAAFPLGGQDEILKCTILNSARSVWSLKEQDLNLAHNLIFNSPKSRVSKTVTCFFYTKPLISFKTRHFI